ncbi:hypothetical protein AsAng_0007550 [Aureispira anguillae]|uniref:Uncharacterized protein n=1 Tax=Aureispira anguillae TaxID=2864201 RepID=A0A915YBJ0_9BACT|nr:hypothetical protein AsAng_0007550 [Aureispira anguillae]
MDKSRISKQDNKLLILDLFLVEKIGYTKINNSNVVFSIKYCKVMVKYICKMNNNNFTYLFKQSC